MTENNPNYKELQTILALLVANHLDTRSKIPENPGPEWADKDFEEAEAAIEALIADRVKAALEQGKAEGYSNALYDCGCKDCEAELAQLTQEAKQ